MSMFDDDALGTYSIRQQQVRDYARDAWQRMYTGNLLTARRRDFYAAQTALRQSWMRCKLPHPYDNDWYTRKHCGRANEDVVLSELWG